MLKKQRAGTSAAASGENHDCTGSFYIEQGRSDADLRYLGTLTAVMIIFSLLVALKVLPSVLLLVTPSRTGEERERMLDLTGLSTQDYRPHSRTTAMAGHD
jgi:hypothetical protein